jgi:hypothetical protein
MFNKYKRVDQFFRVLSIDLTQPTVFFLQNECFFIIILLGMNEFNEIKYSLKKYLMLNCFALHVHQFN